ncbi:dynamin family protein [Geodermatophilus sp. URMC 64]
MTGPDGGDIRDLLDAALDRYADVPAAAARLRAQRDRLDEPLRVGIVGRVKAGKSTLLNALVGERLAPTDAGECTRVVTWYRNGPIPRVVLHPVTGPPRVLPVHRAEGALRLDLGGTPVAEVNRLAVDWPTTALVPMTLVDTPGVASVTAGAGERTRAFVATDEVPAPDALVYLTRQVQPEDLAVLSAFRSATGGAGLATTTLLVLSRADEAASGRLDALIAADDLARRTAEDPAVRALGAGVLPVSGLIGLAGRTLRHRDFVALKSLADADRADAERMLLSVDRFCRPEAPIPVAAEIRASLAERLGLFGIRLSVALIRGGAQHADALADELIRRSGLAELQRLLAVRFVQRADSVKAGTALRTVEQVLRTSPVPGDGTLWAHLERVRLARHDVAELELMGRLAAADPPLPPALRGPAERLLGAGGTGPAERLGLAPDVPEETLRAAALEELRRWRERAADPGTSRAAADACRVVVRTVEGVLAGLDGALAGSAAAQPGA